MVPGHTGWMGASVHLLFVAEPGHWKGGDTKQRVGTAYPGHQKGRISQKRVGGSATKICLPRGCRLCLTWTKVLLSQTNFCLRLSRAAKRVDMQNNGWGKCCQNDACKKGLLLEMGYLWPSLASPLLLSPLCIMPKLWPPFMPLLLLVPRSFLHKIQIALLFLVQWPHTFCFFNLCRLCWRESINNQQSRR